jgi:hypothetical protein
MSDFGNAPTFFVIYSELDAGGSIIAYVSGTNTSPEIHQENAHQIDLNFKTFLEAPDSGTVFQFRYTSTIGVGKHFQQKQLAAFPNPSKDGFFNVGKLNSNTDWEVIELSTGKSIPFKVINNYQIYIKSTGVFVLRNKNTNQNLRLIRLN